MLNHLEEQCVARGLRMTGQRRVITQVISSAADHPDVEQIHQRANEVDPGISVATVYRTVRLLEESGLLARRDFGDGRARYELAEDEHHDHLIDAATGAVIEFENEELRALLREIAARLGYRLVKHRLKLIGRPLAAGAEPSA